MKKSVFPSLRQLTFVTSACLSLSGFSVPAYADSQSFTPEQRKEIVNIVRDALKTDPSILADAVASMQAQATAKQQSDALAAVRAHKDLFGQSNTDIVLGNPHGTLEVVEFYDPRCPYCRKVLPDLDKLVASEHDLRLVEKIVPVLGPNSVLDARAILAAGEQHAYKEFQLALMSDTASPSTDRIRRVAQHIGLNADQLIKDMQSPKVATALHNNIELARSINLDGTPTFVFGDLQIVPGAVSLDELKTALARMRKSH
ncbi:MULTISPECIES: DsbA family protein [Acetobacter]|uniref:DsbA family protein n=1 Tax=Acetobacter TaxID=434 RepID=UPI000A3936AD|nr:MULTISPECIES: DsbA family protein [Acetobacter]MBS1004574.1 DsbA family protein [Acetobacter thailandicus]OUJ10579.1 membrane protein [Acetobacter sp. DsW_059]